MRTCEIQEGVLGSSLSLLEEWIANKSVFLLSFMSLFSKQRSSRFRVGCGLELKK